MSSIRPAITRHYLNNFMDSGRWAHFRFRPDDVLICTPYKSGTTWTQMICALLIFKASEFPAPLAEISPWFDLRPYALEALLNRFEAQTHRRFIKTHTPLDGLPYREEITYLVCGRDPRDVFVSMQHHKANQRTGRVMELMRERGESLEPPPDVPADIDEAFALWLGRGSFPWERNGYPFWSLFHHIETFWDWRALPNIHFLHYADLKSDLPGQMRRVARLLGIDIGEAAWPSLVQAAGFEEMKRHADRLAPDTDLSMWKDNAGFFHSGTSGQWRHALSPASHAAYAAVRPTLGPPAMLDWLECGGAPTPEHGR